MECVNCKYPESKVVKTWTDPKDNKLRRRECSRCGFRFSTIENIKEKKTPAKIQNKVLSNKSIDRYLVR